MKNIADLIRAAGYRNIKEYHDEVGVTGGDSWHRHYRQIGEGHLADIMYEFWTVGPDPGETVGIPWRVMPTWGEMATWAEIEGTA